MATDPSQLVLDEALRLSQRERARIAHELLQSLEDDEDDDVVVLDERAMKAELDRRLVSLRDDLGRLTRPEGSYRLIGARAFDTLPQTAHIEIVAWLVGK